MSNCTEIITNISTIRAFEVGTLSFAAPISLPARHITSAFITGDISGGKIALDSSTIKISEETEQNTGGTLYNVQIQWSVENPDADDLALLTRLKQRAHHFVLENSFGTRRLLRTDPNGYSYSEQGDGTTTTVTIVVQAINGLQRIG